MSLNAGGCVLYPPAQRPLFANKRLFLHAPVPDRPGLPASPVGAKRVATPGGPALSVSVEPPGVSSYRAAEDTDHLPRNPWQSDCWEHQLSPKAGPPLIQFDLSLRDNG